MNICLVSYHYDNLSESRPNFLQSALAEIFPTAKLSIVASDFDHIRKSKIYTQNTNINRIKVCVYKKNISLKRILSYAQFSCRIQNHSALLKADLVVVCVPDYLSAIVLLRSRDKLKYRILIDVVDLWPEAIPVEGTIRTFLKEASLPLIKIIRNMYFRHADLITFQSKYLLSLFGRVGVNQAYLPMCGSELDSKDYVIARPPLERGINIILLGSINNICDIESLILILNMLAIKRKVNFTVIGGGEGCQRLKLALEDTNVVCNFLGITFDSNLIRETLENSHFGYNGYKKSTEVSVSYKSLNYLKCGVPLLNSTKGDTYCLVENQQIGFNFKSGSIEQLVNAILETTDDRYNIMSNNARNVFSKYFSYETFLRELGYNVRLCGISGKVG
jgi:glycosyltransferase involved in cell wall biosynthesis